MKFRPLLDGALLPTRASPFCTLLPIEQGEVPPSGVCITALRSQRR